MATFVYKGRTKAGELVEGSLEGANVEAIAKQLQAQFILPVEIKEEVQQLSQDIDLAKLLPPPQIKMDDMVMFCRQMKALTKAGIPIIQAINGLAEHSKSERLKERFLVRSLDHNTVEHDRWERDELIRKARSFLKGFNLATPDQNHNS